MRFVLFVLAVMVAALVALGGPALAKGGGSFGGGCRGGSFSSGARSFSAPSRAYSAPISRVTPVAASGPAKVAPIIKPTTPPRVAAVAQPAAAASTVNNVKNITINKTVVHQAAPPVVYHGNDHFWSNWMMFSMLQHQQPTVVVREPGMAAQPVPAQQPIAESHFIRNGLLLGILGLVCFMGYRRWKALQW